MHNLIQSLVLWALLTTTSPKRTGFVNVDPDNLPQCPDNFDETDTWCYHFTKKSKFSPSCPFPNVVAFEDYKTIATDKVWMPAQREDYGFMQWLEPGPLYKTNVDNYSLVGTIQDKRCLVYDANSNNTLAVPCWERHPGVCVYEKLDILSTQVCENKNFGCRPSDFLTSKCFCVGTTAELRHPKAQFLKPYQNNVYNLLTNETCAFGLEKLSDGTFVWTTAVIQLQYSYWSADCNFNNSYAAATPQGWILTEEPVGCVLFELKVEVPEPRLELVYNSTSDEFVLNVTDAQSLLQTEMVVCFTDASGWLPLHRYSNDSMQILFRDNNEGLISYKFDPVGSFPGNYWCESHRYSDLALIKSPTIWYKGLANVVFVAILAVEYPVGVNVLTNSSVTSLRNILQITLDGVLTNYSCRLMKIKYIQEEADVTRLFVNVHLINSLIQDDANDLQYFQLQTFLSEAFDNQKIQMTELLNANYCIFVNTSLTWPRAALGQRDVVPDEFCFKSDGTRLTRNCDGNYIDGARWSYITDDCEVVPKSSVSNDILWLIKNIDSAVSTKIWALVNKRLGEYNALDVYLTIDLCNKALSSTTLNSKWGKTFNKLLEIDQKILAESQRKMRSTDQILSLYESVTSSNLNQSSFVYQKYYSISGLVVQHVGNRTVVTPRYGDQEVENITEIENLHGAIWLSPELRKQLRALRKESQLVTLMVFLNDSFFNEVAPSSLTAGKVFGTILPYIKDPGPLYVLSRPTSQSTKTCSYWDYDSSKRGSWKKESKSTNRSPFRLCKFYSGGYFALTTTPDYGVTGDLEDMLVADSTSDELMEKLEEVSDRYHEFGSMDVHLTGQILQRMSGDDEINLTSLAKVVSNLHQVQPDALSGSQQEKGTTDMILQNVDAIVKKHKYESYVNATAENFRIVISDFKEKNFTGLLILKEDRTFQTEILEGNVTIDDVAMLENFDSALFLSHSLKMQMDETTKVAVTVFSNDSLFVVKHSKSRSAGKIFGVILPEIGNYSGPITVFHKVSRNKHKKACVHWYLNETGEIKGYWESDGAGENVFDLVECEFWHTTHFGLLFIERDVRDGHFQYLDTITSITCSISLVGLGCVVLTAVLFEKWRRNTGNQILLNFVFADILQMSVFFASDTIHRKFRHHITVCTITGAVLHYTMVSQFCWMLVIAILNFKRFVKVLGGPPKNVLLKACLVGWVLPLIPVVCLLVTDSGNYVRGQVGLCYPSGYGLYLGVWLPISLVILINFTIFVYIMYSVVHKTTQCIDVGSKEAIFQWRLAVLLFFMLGLTWTFAILSELGLSEIFLYLFCATATLQGFVVFLFFIVFNVNTRFLYLHAIKKRLSKHC